MTNAGFAGRRGIGSQAILLVGATIITQLITAGVYISAARVSSPTEYGPLIAALALGTTAVSFFDLGTNSLWVRETAKVAMSPGVLGARTFSKLLFAGSVAAIWVFFSLMFFPESYFWVAGPIAFAILASQTMQVALRGQAMIERVALAIIIDRVVVVAVLSVLVMLGFHPIGILWIALCLGPIVSAFCGYFFTPMLWRPRLPSWKPVNPWKGSRYYGLSAISVGSQSLDLTIMNAVGGPAAAGLFGAVNRWTQPMGLLSNAFSSASVPYVAKSKSWDESWSHARKAAWLLVLAVIACLVVAIAAPTMVSILIGEEYFGATPVLQLLALGTIPAIFNQPLYVFLQAMRFDRVVSFVISGAVILQLAAVALLATKFGAVGAAMAFVFVQSLIFVLLLVIFVRVRSRPE